MPSEMNDAQAAKYFASQYTAVQDAIRVLMSCDDAAQRADALRTLEAHAQNGPGALSVPTTELLEAAFPLPKPKRTRRGNPAR